MSSRTQGKTIGALTTRAVMLVAAVMDDEQVTQLQLATRARMRQQQVSRFLSATHSPTLRTLARMAYALGYEVRIELRPLKPERTH